MTATEFLPEPLPPDPLPLFATWVGEARERRSQPNPDAMVLATVGADGRPSARVVLCRGLDASAGFVVFYTNYHSRKAREITGHSQVAGVLHWDALHRQVRVEGVAIRSPEQESDDYYARRPIDSRLSAWASDQSAPLASRAALAQQMSDAATRFGVTPATSTATIPRPAHWGGHRLWIDTLELWVEGPGRVHDRAVWRRSLTRNGEFTFATGPWSATRLNP